MFLPLTIRRNPELLQIAADLHRSGDLGPDTFVLDIDRIVENARAIAETGRGNDLGLYVMTKQQGRNPFLARAALEGGIPAAVAVDVPEARVLNLYGIPLGHVGHLVQIPLHEVPDVVAMAPEVITVFTLEHARAIGAAAAPLGIEQPLLLRIWEQDSFTYPGQEGGFEIAELPRVVEEIKQVEGVRIVGATAFPCLLFDYESTEVKATPSFGALIRAIDVLRRDCDVDVCQINAPSVTCVATIPLLREHGATHGEPGSALTGHTPLHAVSDQPEVPAMVYLSEIASVRGDRVYCYGGGYYARSRVVHALVVDGPITDARAADVEPLPADAIDYYGTIRLPEGVQAHPGQAVLCAFRSQVFVARSRVAAVGGISQGRPRILGICDARGNLLGDDLLPVGSVMAAGRVERAWQEYLTGSVPSPLRA